MKSKQPSSWLDEFKPLLKKYGAQKHPLAYKNRYQLIVMVVLSARCSDKIINALAPALFQRYPSMKELAKASPEDLFPYIKGVISFGQKSRWLTSLAKQVGTDENIPHTLEELIKLPAIGRKSANVIMGESGDEMEGVIVDIHTLRVAPRIGIATGPKPEQIEEQLMEKIPQNYWRQLGMSLTMLGREICRPTDPKCPECPVNKVCEYYKKQGR